MEKWTKGRMVEWWNAACGVIEEIRRKFQGNDQEIFLFLLFHNEITMEMMDRLRPPLARFPYKNEEILRK